ncbi:phosphotransferase [Allostreptomyces psammosilenae]|uniref:Aminoglycoside phosphotransferase domain-containing protein n=1 Tax=Allostreptomyces psammosilenae TaxID=1892865 RepID=A0A852ZLJ2_9ACTN|nr:phosphotransferase [Allostreptomyces psammosilenae]NYI03256.1 hypothetical protein [Allostreptomyces psammosilenae]
MEEQPLAGGFVNTVVRVADTVRRTPGPRAHYVHALLRFLEQRGWPGAPRFLGIDDRGREMLSFVPGHVAWEARQPPDVSADASLVRVAELLRAFHDLTAGTPLAAGGEVVCHNDLSPKNTVYAPHGPARPGPDARPDARPGGPPGDAALRPVAFLDWDIAAPGERVHDVAHVCWQYVGLGPTLADPDEAARRIRLIADAYGLSAHDRGRLLDTVLWWQDRCWRGIRSAAAAGEPAMRRLHESGVTERVRAAHAWTAAHRERLTAPLTPPPSPRAHDPNTQPPPHGDHA